jgi:peptidoglycan/LPS O-acetylase OafA/YrhL
VEETFYLFFPLICVTFRRRIWLVPVLLSFVVLGPFGRTVFAHGNEVWKEYSYLGGMDAIALGCLTAMLIAEVRLVVSTIRAIGIVGSLLLIGCLCFEPYIKRLGLEAAGLDMSLLAVGTCLLIVTSVTSGWRLPTLFRPVLVYGRRSYEIYLTHMFVVLGFFDYFMSRTTHTLTLVPSLFLAVFIVSGLLGEVVATTFSEPANRLLRIRLGDDPARLGSVVASPGYPLDGSAGT